MQSLIIKLFVSDHLKLITLISMYHLKPLVSFDRFINPPMVKPFRLTYLTYPPLEILAIACLTFFLLLTDRATLGLPEYKLKVVNICEMPGTDGLLKLWCLTDFSDM